MDNNWVCLSTDFGILLFYCKLLYRRVSSERVQQNLVCTCYLGVTESEVNHTAKIDCHGKTHYSK